MLYGGVATLVLVLLSSGVTTAVPFVLAFVVFVLSAGAVSSALQLADKRTIATFRRVQALIFAGEILWLAMAALGAVCAVVVGSARPLTNALVFGAWLCAGFEFLVINGTFAKSAGLSLALAAIHPVSTLVIVRYPALFTSLGAITYSCGAAALAVFVLFPTLMKRRKTSLGHDAIALFRAFMKTWTGGRAEELEEIIADHSEEVEVVTRVLEFRTKEQNVYLVLPGVHPGPFHPIGSYDLPGVISREFKGVGHVMTLHRPGGHERNLATNEDTQKFAAQVVELARSVTLLGANATIRGPTHSRVGKANVSASAFSKDLIMTISFAPLGSDDLDAGIEAELSKSALRSGFELSVVDAHNSIDQNLESPQLGLPGWDELFEEARKIRPEPFRVAYSHSGELPFEGGSDITENGMGLLMIETGGTKSALVLADANNAVPNLRDEVKGALGSAGYQLIELCTSDSHNLAARGLTVQRGYEALGEATPSGAIADAVAKMAKLAEGRLSPAEYGSARQSHRVRVFGSKALEEFAAITQASSNFAYSYLKLALVAVAALALVAILL